MKGGLVVASGVDLEAEPGEGGCFGGLGADRGDVAVDAGLAVGGDVLEGYGVHEDAGEARFGGGG